MHMITLPSQFKPMFTSDCTRLWFFEFNISRLFVRLIRFREAGSAGVNVVVKVVPSFVVVLLPPWRTWPDGSASMGMTCTGCTADVMEMAGFSRTTSLGIL